MDREEKAGLLQRTLNGDEALAYGALSSGITLVTGYPGSPSSGTVETLIDLAETFPLCIEWSSNEKVAVEMGIGASIAGRRALVCTKSVGLNVMLDPLMAFNLTPAHGGLVILVGDDPGAYGSQNDQDSRPLAAFLEMPLMEPAGPAEGYQMMKEAFSISERYRAAVIVRITRSFAQDVESVEVDAQMQAPVNAGLSLDPFRFMPIPLNAVKKHSELHETIEALAIWSETAPFNQVSGRGNKGIITAGFAYKKLKDVLEAGTCDSYRLLKLGVLFPLPRDTISRFLEECEEVLIVEENEPFLEIYIKALAQECGFTTRIIGKKSRHISREGELFRWQLQRAVMEFLPRYVATTEYLESMEASERPAKENYCTDCRYDEVLDQLEGAARQLGIKPVLIGDPGCLVTVADRLLGKYAIGSAVAVADGISKAGCDERVVALFGDSAFFHSSIPAICSAAFHGSDILMIVLDNKATAASGFQPNPGVKRDALGNAREALDIEQIARACGVKRVYSTSLDSELRPLGEVFRAVLRRPELTLVIVRIDRNKG